ncbi:hypothetical protein CYMTET_33231, partial [Cymbomonas tetramitiformis]
EFRDIFEEIFKGGYTPPSYKLVVDMILSPSAEGKLKVKSAVADLLSEGILPSIGDANFKLHERLVAAIPFSSVRHTAAELESATKTACASMGIGKYEEVVCATTDEEDPDLLDTVAECIHCTVSDNASNIVSGWTCFDGHECAAHTIALTVKTFLEQQRVKKVLAKLRGMTGHFSHSVIGVKLLHECQKRSSLRESKPPQDNDTRSGWGGACKQAEWYMENRVAVQMYDYEHPTKAATAVPNVDGSVYRDHQLDVEEWLIVRESVYILKYASITIDLLQGTHYPTASLLLPMIGKLAHITHPSTALKYEGKPVISHETKLCNGRGLHRESDWAPKKEQESCDGTPRAAQVAAPKDNRGTTVASFLADSDDEDESDDVGPLAVEEKDELAAYLDTPSVPLISIDLQEWWRVHTTDFPSLAKMARQFLAVPATSAGVERAFSKVSSMHSDLRKNLTEGTIEHSVMASMNTVDF